MYGEYCSDNFYHGRNNETINHDNTKNTINGYIRIRPKSNRNNNKHENIRSKSLNPNNRGYINYYKNYIKNNIDNTDLTDCEYINDIIEYNGYIQRPYSINNGFDKKRWKIAHNLRNKMKEYDLITRKKLYESNIINSKAKLDRERFVILNKIPIFREAFPAKKKPTYNSKENIIRSYLKTHADYILSKREKNKNNYKTNQKRNNSLMAYNENRNYFNYSSHNSRNSNSNNKNFSINNKPEEIKISGTYNTKNMYHSDKHKKKNLTYKSHIKNNEKIKNRAMTPHISKNFEIKTNGAYNKANGLYNTTIGGYNKINNEYGQKNYNRSSFRQPNNIYNLHGEKKIGIITLPPKNIHNANEKREPYDRNSNNININAYECDTLVHENVYDYSDELKGTHINDNSYANTYVDINSNYQHMNQFSNADECLTAVSNTSQGIYTCNNLKHEKPIFQKNRYSLFGKIKNNKDVKVELVLDQD